MEDVIKDGAVVSLSYTLKLADGDVIDYSEADDPLEYLHGAENIIPGLEQQLVGLKVGDEKDVELAPADGYGVYDPEDVEVVERKELPKDLQLKLGMVLAISDEDGSLSEAFVREITPNEVKLDFNHPLAGQRLFFKVKVLDVREATAEEIAHGHPHGEGGHHHGDDDDFDDDEDYMDFLDDEDDDDIDVSKTHLN